MDYKAKINDKGLKHWWVAKQIGIHPVLLSYYLNKVRAMPEDVNIRLKEILL